MLRPPLRGAVGLPLALVAPLCALVGLGGAVARLQLRLADSSVRQGATPGFLRTAGHSLMVLPPALVSFTATTTALFTVYSGYLYPIRPDVISTLGHPFTPDHATLGNAWGGPTLAGAWLAHAGVALGIQLVALLIVHASNALQGWFTQVWLSGDGHAEREGQRTGGQQHSADAGQGVAPGPPPRPADAHVQEHPARLGQRAHQQRQAAGPRQGF